MRTMKLSMAAGLGYFKLKLMKLVLALQPLGQSRQFGGNHLATRENKAL